MDFVPVTTANDAGLASIIQGVLEQAGIRALVAGGGSGDVYPTPSVSPFQIMVEPADADRARDVLAQYDTVPDDEDEDL
jgi:Putative prokaryotic signal transducing protein